MSQTQSPLSLNRLGELSQLCNVVTSESGMKPLQVELLQVDQIISQAQPRLVFEKIDELAESLKAIGLQQPIIVNPLGNGKYVIEQGERRWRAAKLAGLPVIKCIVSERGSDEQECFIRQLTENMQRDNMKLYELSQAIAKLVSGGLTMSEIARKLGKKKSYISNLYAVATLPPEIDEAVQSGLIQDPQAARRLRNLYEAHKEDVCRQLRSWKRQSKKASTEDDGTDAPSVSRAQIMKFSNELERQDRRESQKASDNPDSEMESDNSIDNNTNADSEFEYGNTDSETESCQPARPDQLVIRIELEPDAGDEDADIVSGELALDVLPPAGKLCILLDTSQDRLVVDSRRVRIISTELR